MRTPDLFSRLNLPSRHGRRSTAESKASLLTRVSGDGRSRTSDALIERIALAATVVIVAFFWLPTMFRSLWTAETVALWTVDTDLSATIDRAGSLQEASPAYYVLMNLWTQVMGTSEFMLRLPSLLAAVGAAYFVYQLGRGLHRRITGLVAALVFVGFQTVFIGATSMAPFALEVLLLLVSARALMWWVAEPRLVHGIVWIVAAVGAVYMHPFALLALIAHGVFLKAVRGHGMARDVPQLAGLVALGALAMVPLISQFADLIGNRELLLLHETVSITGLLIVLIPPVVMASWLVGLAFARRISDEPTVSGDPATLMVVWAVLPPVVVFGLAVVSGYDLFSGQYYIAALPALALLLGGMFSRLTSTDGRRIAVVLLVALSFLAIAPSGGSTVNEDWKGAVGWSNSATAGNDASVLVASGLPQSRDVGVLLNPAMTEYLLSPVRAYGLQSDAIALPFDPSGAAASYLELGVIDKVQGREQVVVISREAQGFADYGVVVAAGLAADGFSIAATPDFAGLKVTLLERS